MISNNVLIIDDSDVDRKLMKSIIERNLENVNVIESDNSHKIKYKIEKYGISVIVLDLILDNKNGLDVLRDLRLHESLRNIPVIIFSSITNPEVIKEALTLGAYDYFEKPLSINDIKFAFALKINNALKMKIDADKINYLRDHDHLTTLYSRGYLESKLEKYDSDVLPLSLGIIDINGLKIINDAFGYNTGEKIIIEISHKLKAYADRTHCIARWGSDEFAITMENTDYDEASFIIEEIVNDLHQSNDFEFEVSFGLKTISNDGYSYTELMRGAEDHLSSNKVLSDISYRNNMIKTITSTLHQKNPREEYHSRRVSEICEKIGKELSFSSFEVKRVKLAGLLHDIGKIAIDEAILNKDGKLTNLEWLSIKRHPEIGFRILSTSKDTLELANAVLGHHERWDGNGYPRALSGERIPLMARVICVADTFDALTSYRTYRTAVTAEEAIAEIKRCSGTQFDPLVVDAFIKVMTK